MEICFVLRDGSEKRVDASVGETLLDVIQANQIPVKGMCGGAGVCGSCRVKIFPPSDQISPAEDSELDLLDTLQSDENVRLACQVVLLEGCEALRVELL